jgi:uncharacterized protein (DUF697 family)
MMSNRIEADRIVRSHVLWSMGAGLIPLPILDLVAVTSIQLDMLRQIAQLYGADYAASAGKAFVSALTGGAFARLGATLVKSLPGVGTVLGGVSMSVMSGASTYAVGQVVISHLETGKDFLAVDLDWVRQAYDEAFERGKEYAAGLKTQEGEAEDVFEALEKLGELKEKGILTDEEFEAQKQKLLDRL